MIGDLDRAHIGSVFFTKQGDCAFSAGLLEGLAFFANGSFGCDHLVHEGFDLEKIVFGDGMGGIVKVEA